MVAQRGGSAVAGVGEESSATSATALAGAEQQQQAASMEAMLQAMMVQMSSVVGAVRDLGDRVGDIERRESISALD